MNTVNSHSIELYNQWIKGISKEIRFWIKKIKPKSNHIQKKFEFIYPELLVDGVNTRILECACGPRGGRSGQLFNGEPLANLHCTDALALAYSIMHQAFNYTPAAPISFAFCERLTSKYEDNYFDIIVLHNGLDHCFDPLWSLVEMLSVIKPGGVIKLEHLENEHDRASSAASNNVGFHQWNICTDNDGSFLIKNDVYTYNCNDIFKEIACINVKKCLQTDDIHNSRNYIETEIIKTNEFTINKDIYITLNNIHISKPPFDSYYESTFHELLKLITLNFCELNISSQKDNTKNNLEVQLKNCSVKRKFILFTMFDHFLKKLNKM